LLLSRESRLTEFELDEPPRYEGSTPVRIGKAASDQFQLFGEVVNTIRLGPSDGRHAQRGRAADTNSLNENPTLDTDFA
jgi:hypothetical protein